MKKYLLYALTALMAASSTSCKDEIEFNGPEDLDRMPMTMFRRGGNTGYADKDNSDPYRCMADEEELNTIHLRWLGIEGAAGYQIKYCVGQGGNMDQWNDDSQMKEILTVGPEATEISIQNLEYDTQYSFAIRVLSPLGEGHHSLWYGYGNLHQWDDVCSLKTLNRYATPGVINTGEKDYEAFTVFINLDYASSGDNSINNFTENFEVVDGKYVADRIQVVASPTNPDAAVPAKWADYKLTPEDIAAGQVRVDGLSPNSVYVVNLINSNKIFNDPRTGKPVTVDAAYNTMTIRTKGDPGEPILVPHYVDPADTIPGAVEYNACRLDTIILNYTRDINLAEGQAFYLEGGKNYYLEGNTTLCKGFRLETNPEDLAQGKRATVFLGGIRMNGTSPVTNNFMFGRTKEDGEADAPIQVESIVFKGIDFDCPLAENYGVKGANGTGNYFANMYSTGMAVEFESLEMYDCSFQHFIRGFIRLQGSKTKVFKKVVIDGCLFYNNGYYDNNGRGYGWFHDDTNPRDPKGNFFTDFTVRNSTFYDSPRTAMFVTRDNDCLFNDDIHFNITLENNTFINLSTRTSGRNIFQLRYIPGGSKFTLKRNLFVLAKSEGDNRELYNTACDIRNINGTGVVTVEFEDNYSAGCLDAHMKDDGIFTGAAFSATNRSLGAFVPNRESLVVKVGSTPLKATDLFVNPNPIYKAATAAEANKDYHAGPRNILEDLKYKNTSAVHNHEIYTKNVGDPRWRQ